MAAALTGAELKTATTHFVGPDDNPFGRIRPGVFRIENFMLAAGRHMELI
jgi:hypothetical protein